MSNDFAQFMAKLATAAGNEILVKAAEVEPPKVRRGRPRKPARVMIRLDRGGPNGMAYVVGDGPKRSLGITGENMAAAEVSAQLRRMAAEAAAVGLYSPRQIPLEVIFEDYKKWAHPGPKGTVEQIRDHEQTCRRLNRVLKQMKVITRREDVRIGDIKPANCRAYDAWLQKQPVGKSENPQSTLSVGSSRMDLGFARAAVNRFAEEHVIAITNGFWVPERPEPRQNWLTRRQISGMRRSSVGAQKPSSTRTRGEPSRAARCPKILMTRWFVRISAKPRGPFWCCITPELGAREPATSSGTNIHTRDGSTLYEASSGAQECVWGSPGARSVSQSRQEHPSYRLLSKSSLDGGASKTCERGTCMCSARQMAVSMMPARC
jgi:hypothetical protein